MLVPKDQSPLKDNQSSAKVAGLAPFNQLNSSFSLAQGDGDDTPNQAHGTPQLHWVGKTGQRERRAPRAQRRYVSKRLASAQYFRNRRHQAQASRSQTHRCHAIVLDGTKHASRFYSRVPSIGLPPCVQYSVLPAKAKDFGSISGDEASR
jgi:hypothetical protein